MEEDGKAAMGGVRIFENLGTVEGRLLRLEVVVLLSALVLAVLVLYGSTRRRSSDRLLRGVMFMAYSLSYVVVTYAVGIIQDGPFHGETFVLWAAALLLIQASAYAAPVHSRRDVDQRKKLLLQHVLQTGLVLWLILKATGTNTSYRAAIWAFWSLNVLKTAAKIGEMVKASLPDRSVKVVAEYMDVEESLAAADQQPADPKTMRGYRYLFHGEETMELSHEYGRLSREEILAQSTCKSVVTIDRVYRWIDEQGYSEVEKDMAKDFCLAFALFKLLKRRFYGYVPAEAGSAKARDLVLNGLIHQQVHHPQHDPRHHHHRDVAALTGPDAAFRVVEAELAFLYDFFYTRNIVLVGVRTYIFIAVVVMGLTMWTAFFGTLGPGYRRLVIGVKDLDRSVTVVVIVITAALEMCQALAAFSNNWRYTKTVYRCVRDGRPWHKKRRGGHLWWKENITPPQARYWENKIGEYVLLKRYSHRPLNLLSWMTLFLVEPRRQGQKRERRKELPVQVRHAVLMSFKASRGRLSNGVSTLGRHRLLPRLAWACEFAKVTDQILVWHVVTTRCDWLSRPRRRRRGDHDDDDHSGDGGGDNRVVAMKLSNYCAYLVAFVPEMLPDPSYNAEQIFDTAVRQTRCHLASCGTKQEILAQLDKIEAHEQRYVEGVEAGGGGAEERAGSSTVVEKAVQLGGQLRAAVGPDGERLWAFLAEFWAELVLFLAPSDNVDVHAEMLGAGGEFMTQLWALLAHAGVLERPAAARSSAPASAT